MMLIVYIDTVGQKGRYWRGCYFCLLERNLFNGWEFNYCSFGKPLNQMPAI